MEQELRQIPLIRPKRVLALKQYSEKKVRSPLLIRIHEYIL